MFLNSSLKKQIDNAKVISFDIFDTLLLRPYIKPTDLFLHMEQLYNCTGFAKQRVIAEQESLAQSPMHDVTLDEIYQRLQTFGDLKQREIELETSCLVANPEMIDVWQYAKTLGKKIIIISDMYLSKSILANILEMKGFHGYDFLYVSNDTHERKDNGLLYRRILADLRVSAKSILHIGDNEYSDVKVAQKVGFKSVHYPKITECFFNENPAVKAFLSNDASLEKSLFLGNLIVGWHQFKYYNPKASYWHKIGYLYGAPIHYAYVQWLADKVRTDNLSGLLFIARDGYTTQKLFNKFYKDIPSYYIYAPRFTNMLSRLDFGKESCIRTERELILLRFLSQVAGLSLDGIDLSDKDARSKLLSENRALLENYAKMERDSYIHYISSLHLPTGSLGVVDSVSLSFSAQKLVSSSCTNLINGYYVNALAHDKNVFSFSQRGSDILFCHFIEFLMAAPEKPIMHIRNDSPVYKTDIDPHEKYKIDIYPDICKGSLSGAEFLNYQHVMISESLWYQWFDAFYNNPNTEDKQMMANIQNGIDSAHTKYEPIFPNWYATDKMESVKKKEKYIRILGILILKICKKKFATKMKKTFYLFGFIPVLKYKRRKK